MFHTLEEFLSVWKEEGTSTQKILDALTDESLDQAATAEDRTLGRSAWHIVTSLHTMLSRTGLQFEAAHDDTEEAVPDDAAAIADAYRQANHAMQEAIRSSWTDETLKETSDMFGQMWPNSLTLQMVVLHQVHHRGQLTVLMRQAGLRVPGVYGPSREEWTAMGVPAPM